MSVSNTPRTYGFTNDASKKIEMPAMTTRSKVRFDDINPVSVSPRPAKLLSPWS